MSLETMPLSFLSNEKAFISGLKHPQNNVRSQYAREIAKNVGEEYYARGEAAKAEKKFADAYRYWMLAAKFEDSPKALANANTIEEFARNLYRQAEFKEIKNPQEGIRLWKQVLTILPADHELHRKAQAKLARSQQP